MWITRPVLRFNIICGEIAVNCQERIQRVCVHGRESVTRSLVLYRAEILDRDRHAEVDEITALIVDDIGGAVDRDDHFLSTRSRLEGIRDRDVGRPVCNIEGAAAKHCIRLPADLWSVWILALRGVLR